MIEAVTPNGKGIQLVIDRRYATYKFQFSQGGELPVELSGVFTNEASASAALAKYLDKAKAKKNAER